MKREKKECSTLAQLVGTTGAFVTTIVAETISNPTRVFSGERQNRERGAPGEAVVDGSKGHSACSSWWWSIWVMGVVGVVTSNVLAMEMRQRDEIDQREMRRGIVVVASG